MANPFDVQGHRGARGLFPENTLAGFEAAIALGATTLELDVGISADGVIMVCHDTYLDPELWFDAEGKPLPDIPRLWLKDLTQAELQSFRCGLRNPYPHRFPEQQCIPSIMPTLEQVFALAEAMNPQICYNIEPKVSPLYPHQTVSPARFAEALVTCLEQHQLLVQSRIQSFDWRVLRSVRELCPLIQTGALVLHSPSASTLCHEQAPSPFLAGWDWREFAGNLAALLQATGFVDIYSPNFEALLPESEAFLQPCWIFQEMGFQVIPWTVNEVADMEQLIRLGVNGIITDFPDRLISLLKQQGKV